MDVMGSLSYTSGAVALSATWLISVWALLCTLPGIGHLPVSVAA
jgi:hypothetical protein